MGLHPESTSWTFLFFAPGSGIIAVALAVPAPRPSMPLVRATGVCPSADRVRIPPNETTQAGLDSNSQPSPQRDTRARGDGVRRDALSRARLLHANRPLS